MALSKIDKAERFLSKALLNALQQLPGYEGLTHIYPDYAFSEMPQCPDRAAFSFSTVAGCADHKRIIGTGWITGWNGWMGEEWQLANFAMHTSLDHVDRTVLAHSVGGEVISTVNEPNKSKASEPR